MAERAGAPASSGTTRVAVFAVVVVFALLSSAVAMTTPAWEAADEPDHAKNVETLVNGRWYRMERGAGLAAHQPPLYYLGLSTWQRLWGVPTRRPPTPNFSRSLLAPGRGLFKHGTTRDSADHRFVLLLRLTSVLLGALTVLLTAATARRFSSDPWTPAVASAVVAGVPTFVFLSGVLNNDNLANALGGLLTLLAVVFVVRAPDAGTRARLWWTAALGGVLGLLVLTKLSTVVLAGGVVVSVLIGVRSWRERAKTLCVAAGSLLAVCGWWLVQNQVRYGDPLAAKRSRDYLEPIGGLGGDVSGGFVLGPGGRNPFKLFLVDVPANIYHSFWYNSGWNTFRWSSFAYIVFWVVLLIAVAGLVVARRQLSPTIARPALVLVTFAVGALMAVWITASQTTTFQARLAFTGLPAIGCLAALGLERWRAPIPVRFVGPVIGLVGTIIAIRQDILNVNWF